MRIAVVALGKIGLPLAVQFADSGHEVIGVDVNPETVDLVNAGVEPFPGEAHLQEKLSELVPAGRLRATTDYAEAIPEADAVVLVVPLFVNDETWEPDFEWMDAATKSLAEHLTPDTLISYETTLPGPGIHLVAVEEKAALRIPFIGGRCQICADLPHRVRRKAAQLSAGFCADHIRVHAVLKHAAGFTHTTGLFRAAAQKCRRSTTRQRLFPQPRISVKQKPVRRPVSLNHLAQCLLHQFVSIKYHFQLILLLFCRYCTTQISEMP